jgi:hypothetical protein
MKIIIFDFEVFKYDVLLGVYDANEKIYMQTWDLEEIKDYYKHNTDAIWVGHNNSHYDNFILQSILLGIDPYETSKSIIDKDAKLKLEIPLIYYDVMTGHFTSLKVIEAYMGKNISESLVDFNISRPLTDAEKLETESYNRDDLNQTFEDLKMVKNEFQLRLELIKEFNLPSDALHSTEAQIAAMALHARKVKDIEENPVNPVIYDNLRVKNKRIIDFYLGESWAWKNGCLRKSIKVDFCGTTHTIAAGGIHAGDLRHEKEALYLDVSGYYNLVMINYNLLSRAIPEKGRKLYEFMYHEQLRLKKINPIKRNVYKVILLAVFGAQSNKYCDFYDPYQGDLVRLTGEMFLVDLLEKLEGKADVIQSNTDGIMLKPLVSEEEIMEVVNEWQNRTKFVLKVEKIYDIIQRDVNNYMYRDDKGNIHVKGEAVKHWECFENPFIRNSYDSKEPLIISKCIVEYYMNGKKPEETVEENKDNIRLFQFICKKGTYDYLEYDDGVKPIKLQKVNRVFVGKECYGVIYKCKGEKRDRYSSVPTGIFVHNEAININLNKKIKYNYYVRRAYERIEEFRLKPEQLSLF